MNQYRLYLWNRAISNTDEITGDCGGHNVDIGTFWNSDCDKHHTPHELQDNTNTGENVRNRPMLTP